MWGNMGNMGKYGKCGKMREIMQNVGQYGKHGEIWEIWEIWERLRSMGIVGNIKHGTMWKCGGSMVTGEIWGNRGHIEMGKTLRNLGEVGENMEKYSKKY